MVIQFRFLLPLLNKFLKFFEKKNKSHSQQKRKCHINTLMALSNGTNLTFLCYSKVKQVGISIQNLELHRLYELKTLSLSLWFKYTSNPTFCHATAESIWHLIYFCKLSSDFWRHVLHWLKDT